MLPSRYIASLVACVAVGAGLVRAAEPLPLQPVPQKPPILTDRYGDPLPSGAVARLGSIRFWHTTDIQAVAFAPDGKTLASGSEDGTLRLWNVATAQELPGLPRPYGLVSVNALAFAPDGKTLVAGSTSGLYLWDVPAQKTVRHVRALGQADFLAFSPDGKTIAAGGSGTDAIHLWDPVTGKERHRLAGGDDAVTAVAFSRDGKLVASAGVRGRIHVWDSATGRQRRRLGTDRLLWVRSLAFSADGKILAAGGSEESVLLWDVATGKELPPLSGHQGCIDSIAFSPDGKRLASGSWDQTVRVWAVATGEERCCLRGHVGKVRIVAFHPDGRTLASVGDSRDQTIRLWHVAAGQPGKPIDNPEGHRRPVLALAFSFDGQTLASGGLDGSVRLWQFATGRELRSLAGHTSFVRSLAFSADNSRVASGGYDNTIRTWDCATGKELHCFRGHEDSIAALAFAPDDRTLAAVGGTIRVWDGNTGKELRCASGENFVAFSPRGRVLVQTGPDELTLRVLATGKELRRFRLSSAARPLRDGESAEVVLAAVFSADGRRLLTARSGTVSLWDARSGKELSRFDAPPEASHVLALSADSRLLALAYGDRRIRLWEVPTGKEVGQFQGHGDLIAALVFSPDGKTVVSGSRDTTILVWDLTDRMQGMSLPPVALAAGDLETLWTDLLAEDARQANHAVWKLVAADRQAVPFLRERLAPVPKVVNARQIAQLIADLDDRRFRVRERARQALERQGDLVEPFLVQTLEGRPTLEVRRRVEELLAKLARPTLSREDLRVLRAQAALEYMGTSAAQDVLRALAQGEPGARLTQEAQASLDRLARLHAARR
jgi:WD40 repeat protein